MCDSGGSPRRTTSNERNGQSRALLPLALVGRQFWSRSNKSIQSKTRGQICGGDGAETGSAVIRDVPMYISFLSATFVRASHSNSTTSLGIVMIPTRLLRTTV